MDNSRQNQAQEISEDEGIPGASPWSPQAEQGVLGAMLIDNFFISKTISQLDPNDFYREAHQVLYRIFVDLNSRSMPVDMITIIEEVKKPKWISVGAAGITVGYLAALLDMLPATAYIEHYIDIIRDHSMKRKLMGAAQSIYSSALSCENPGEVAYLIANARNDLETLAKSENIKDTLKGHVVLSDALYEIKARSSDPAKRPTRGTGIAGVDEHIRNIKAGSTTILAAISGFGKSALAHQIAERWARVYSIPVGIWSGEMTGPEIMIRRLSAMTGIDSKQIDIWTHLSLEQKQRISDAEKVYEQIPIHLIEPGDPSLNHLVSAVRSSTDRNGIGLWVIDHIGHLQSDRYKNSKVQEVGHISDTLKNLALSLNVPFIVLSQLNRGLFGRDDKRPNEGDLRDSGSIYANAGIVLFLHMPRHFQKKADREPLPYMQPEQVEIIVNKARNGSTGIVKCGWIAPLTKFADLEKHHVEKDEPPVQYEAAYEEPEYEEDPFANSFGGSEQ